MTDYHVEAQYQRRDLYRKLRSGGLVHSDFGASPATADWCASQWPFAAAAYYHPGCPDWGAYGEIDSVVTVRRVLGDRHDIWTAPDSPKGA